MESETSDPSNIFDISPVVVPGFLSEDNCRLLVSYFHEGVKESGKLRPAVRIPNQSEAAPAAKSIRSNTVCWLEETEKSAWIYNKLRNLMKEINDKVYRFEVDQLQPVQLTKYKFSSKEESEFYGPHLDICARGWIKQRKLSLSLQLSHPQDYEGGNLLLFGDQNDLIMDPSILETHLLQRRQHGTAIIFPSFFEHEVTPVTKGTRYSLVAWMEGPNWK